MSIATDVRSKKALELAERLEKDLQALKVAVDILTDELSEVKAAKPARSTTKSK